MGVSMLRCNAKYKGFFLIELLVAILLISGLSLVFAHYQGKSHQICAQTNQRIQAMHTATTFLEEVIGGSLAISAQGKKNIDDEYELIWKLSNPPKIQGLSVADQCKIIEVTVTWDEHGHQRTVTLQTGILR